MCMELYFFLPFSDFSKENCILYTLLNYLVVFKSNVKFIEEFCFGFALTVAIVRNLFKCVAGSVLLPKKEKSSHCSHTEENLGSFSVASSATVCSLDAGFWDALASLKFPEFFLSLGVKSFLSSQMG